MSELPAVVTTPIELRNADGLVLAVGEGEFVEVGNGTYTLRRETAFAVRNSGIATTARVQINGLDRNIPLAFGAKVRAGDTATIRARAIAGIPGGYREGFDPKDAATWTAEEQATYDTGFREGENDRDADITVVADDWTTGDRDIVDRLIAGGWKPPS